MEGGADLCMCVLVITGAGSRGQPGGVGGGGGGEKGGVPCPALSLLATADGRDEVND